MLVSDQIKVLQDCITKLKKLDQDKEIWGHIQYPDGEDSGHQTIDGEIYDIAVEVDDFGSNGRNGTGRVVLGVYTQSILFR